MHIAKSILRVQHTIIFTFGFQYSIYCPMWRQLMNDISTGNVKSLARAISLVENEAAGYEELLQSLPASTVPVIGITGPPGAGKSTLTDGLIGSLVGMGKKVAVLCIDPSSPFNLGALLGDRIRMSEWYNHPHVFIRSLATRGSLGGLHPKIIEVTDLVKSAGFDLIIVETVGVGQSEIEIAGLADVTAVVLVPESGDDVQTMKAGLMEIADLFVVNKSDRPGADMFIKNLRTMTHDKNIQIIKAIASKREGVDLIIKEVFDRIEHPAATKRSWLLAEKAFHLIQNKKMAGVKRADLEARIKTIPDFNLYKFISEY
jgi:LAO/AO transport system kinase